MATAFRRISAKPRKSRKISVAFFLFSKTSMAPSSDMATFQKRRTYKKNVIFPSKASKNFSDGHLCSQKICPMSPIASRLLLFCYLLSENLAFIRTTFKTFCFSATSHRKICSSVLQPSEMPFFVYLFRKFRQLGGV